ncbi:MAG: PadR family transcriptional regulator [Propionibacteriaceae bacterium]|nr:PadR family transcriptional regulator [Propionibacteriaceae bacterium]
MTISRKNPLALMALCVLWQTPTHPYGIVQYLKATYKDKAARLNYGSLYTVIGQLEKAGLIEAVEVTRAGNLPPRTTYQVTGAGITEMNAWLSDLLANPIDEAPQYLTALSILPAVSVDEALVRLRSRADTLRQTVADMEADRARIAPLVPEIFSLDAYYQLAIARAELAFTDDLVARIESGELGCIDLWRDIYASLKDGRPDWAQVTTAFESAGFKAPNIG